MKNVSDKSCRENQNTILYSITPPPKIVTFCDNVEKCGTAGQATDGNTTRRMRFSSLITNVTNTHSEYLITIAFLRQKLLNERAFILGLHVRCLSYLQIMLRPWFEFHRKHT